MMFGLKKYLWIFDLQRTFQQFADRLQRIQIRRISTRHERRDVFLGRRSQIRRIIP